MEIIWQLRTSFGLGFVHIPLNNTLGNLKLFFVYTVYPRPSKYTYPPVWCFTNIHQTMG